jgi:hypothetical protein
MIPLMKQFVHDLLYSPERVTLWIRMLWFAVWQAVAQVTATGALPISQKYAPWIGLLSVAALGAKAGDKNKP